MNNSQVTADGMKVQAQAESGIEISYDTTDTWGTTATSSQEAGKLYPTSTKDTTAWYYAKANASTSKDAIKDTYKNLKTDMNMDDNGEIKTQQGETTTISKYFLLSKFKIRATSATGATNLKVDSVTVSAPADKKTENLNKALRVAVVDATGKALIYAPAGGQTSYQIWDGSSTNGPTEEVTAYVGNEADGQATAVASIDTNGTEIKVYTWYEGEDQDLKSQNLPGSGVTIDTLNVTIKFSATV